MGGKIESSRRLVSGFKGEHSAILSTFIKLPFVFKIFVLSIFEWLFYTGFTLYTFKFVKFMTVCSFSLCLFLPNDFSVQHYCFLCKTCLLINSSTT